MRKWLAVASVAVLVLLLTSASTPSTATRSNNPISCVIDIQFDCVDGDCAWRGPITGCILSPGTIEFRETPLNRVAGKTEHFFEKFIIYAPGGTISGDDAGVWNFATFKFRANGWVTAASTPYADLVGAKFHEMGTTSDPDSTWPITGFGTVMTLH